MIDCKKFGKIYEKIQLDENHNLVVGQISKLTGVDANTVLQVANELGFVDLSSITQDQYTQLCAAVKDTTKLTTPKKEPIKDENNLDSLNEAEPDADTTDNQDQSQNDNIDQSNSDLSLLYLIVDAYFMATVKKNPKAVEMIKLINDSPIFTKIKAKYAIIAKQGEADEEKDSDKPSLQNLNTKMAQTIRAIVKNKKDSKNL